ncbi:unnamed protein product [Calicophoron daubneyi]|uniref:Uncharacterized protein n=1 Tax=Calicophoron daubneyi TaxID=300641 RepID=A0AAV2TL00_CALDB
MKMPWPQPFEDGDVREFLADFEDVAEAVGVKTERAKLVALRSLLRGRARAVLEAARAANVQLEWSAAKEALLAGFNGLADRQAAMQRFKNAIFPTGSDPLVFAILLRKELSRALPNLEKSSAELILTDKFLDAMPAQMASQLKLAALVRQMTLEEMAEKVRSLSSEERQVASLERLDNETELQRLEDIDESLAQELPTLGDKRRAVPPTSEAEYSKDTPADAVCQAFNTISEPDEEGPPMTSSSENERMVTEEVVSVREEKEKEQKKEEDEQEAEGKEEGKEQKENEEQFCPEKEVQETRCLKIDQDLYPEEEPQEPEILKSHEHAMSNGIRRTCIKPKKNSFYQPSHAPLPSRGFGTLVQKPIRIWNIYRNRKKKNKVRKSFKGGGVMRRRNSPFTVPL